MYKRHGELVSSRLKTYPAQIKVVLAFLVLEFLIPLFWLFLGAFLPTIPFIALGIMCWLAITSILSLSGIVGVALGREWGRIFAILSLLWLLVTTSLLFVLEIFRFLVTDYPDPILYSVAEAALFLCVLICCLLGIAWLLGKYWNMISSHRVSE